jgi:hypothetical protein
MVKLKVVYEDGDPTVINNYPGDPSFQFRMEGSTAVQEGDITWHHSAGKITEAEVDSYASMKKDVLLAVRDLPFVQAIKTAEEMDSENDE